MTVTDSAAVANGARDSIAARGTAATATCPPAHATDGARTDGATTGVTDLPTEAEALAAAAQVIAEDLQRQAERTPLEAARAALGAHASTEALDAWVAKYRPTKAARQTA